jgi:hypothetical protein
MLTPSKIAYKSSIDESNDIILLEDCPEDRLSAMLTYKFGTRYSERVINVLAPTERLTYHQSLDALRYVQRDTNKLYAVKTSKLSSELEVRISVLSRQINDIVWNLGTPSNSSEERLRFLNDDSLLSRHYTKIFSAKSKTKACRFCGYRAHIDDIQTLGCDSCGEYHPYMNQLEAGRYNSLIQKQRLLSEKLLIESNRFLSGESLTVLRDDVSLRNVWIILRPVIK